MLRVGALPLCLVLGLTSVPLPGPCLFAVLGAGADF